MDKKDRKRIQVLLDRLKNREQQMIGANQQRDHAEERDRILREIGEIKAALKQLREA